MIEGNLNFFLIIKWYCLKISVVGIKDEEREIES